MSYEKGYTDGFNDAMDKFIGIEKESNTEDVRYLLRVINNKKSQGSINKQTLWQLTKGRFKKVNTFDCALDRLEENHFISIECINKGIGRPKIIIHLNKGD